MAKVSQVLRTALLLILSEGSEAELQPDEYEDAIFTMNNLMTGLDADGVQLGYTIVSNLSDEVTVPDGALQGVIANTAVHSAPFYDAEPSPALVLMAENGMKTMEKLGVNVGPSALPSTMPIGSGNEGCNTGGNANYHFYPDLEATILGEISGNIALESGTEESIS